MKFRATGRDVSSGQPIEMVFEAADAQAAFASAQVRGIVVEAINPVSGVPPVPPPTYAHPSQHAPALAGSPRKKRVRGWAVLVVFAAFIGAVVEPLIGFLFFGLITLLMVLYVVPSMQGLSRAALGLSAGRPFATAVKLMFLGLLAMVILFTSIGSQSQKTSQRQAKADRMKIDAEKQRLIAEGNAKVDRLMATVKERMDANDVAGASTTLTDVLNIQHATNKGPGQRLHESIALSRDSAAVREKLLALSDEEFAVFASDGQLPSVFNLGYPVLNEAVGAIAHPMVADVKIERAAVAKKRAEEDEERRKEQLARSEAERKERERKAAAEAAAKAVAQKELKDKLDAYLAVIQLDDFATQIVDRVGVERRGDSWTATITVKNLWHIRNKQLRLQDAQNLWHAWAVLASKNDPDRARIKLVDLNGNEVGGSRVLGGIWVQD